MASEQAADKSNRFLWYSIGCNEKNVLERLICSLFIYNNVYEGQKPLQMLNKANNFIFSLKNLVD